LTFARCHPANQEICIPAISPPQVEKPVRVVAWEGEADVTSKESTIAPIAVAGKYFKKLFFMSFAANNSNVIQFDWR
jgi:hypothetical protein